jgi:MFS family permease
MQIGWLTAGPALVNLAVSLPAARWLEKRPLARITFLTALLQRVGYLALAALPWLFVARLRVSATIWMILLMSFPAALLAIAFNALFAEVVPAEQRAEVVGRRNALLAFSQTFSALAAGQLLDNLAFPINYQIVFVIGAIGGIVSAFYVSRLQSHAPERLAFDASSMPVDPPEDVVIVSGDDHGENAVPTEPFIPDDVSSDFQPSTFDLRLKELRRVVDRLASPAALRLSLPDLSLLRGVFGRFMLAYLSFYTFQYLCLPIFPLSFVNVLQLTDGMISLGSVLFYVTMFFASLRLGPMARRWGDRRLLGVSGMLFGIYPLLLAFAQGPLLYWIASFVGGMVYAVISAALINRLMARVPGEQRAAGMAFHNLALNLGILIGSFSGPLLSDAMGLQQSLLVSAGLRVVAGILLWLWG